MLRNFLLLLFTFYYTNTFSQSHWESIVVANQNWTYLEASAEPPANWMDAGFDDSAWLTGQGGFGYGDGDDATIVGNVPSVYLRTTFNVSVGTEIENLLLDVDYDDGFVAYLNGVEVARSANLMDEIPLYNSTLSIDHEARIYQGQKPERYQLTTDKLQLGVNVLAIQVINVNTSSSDLSLLAYLQAEIKGTSLIYTNTPSWFWEPVNYEASNLPIIKINTSGQNIEDAYKITAHMGIINNAAGVINNFTDAFDDYDGQIGIEIRGQSSQMFPKKSYGLETRDSLGNNNNVPLLNMPAENDWILYAPYSDKSLIRNVFTFELARKLGHYCTRTAYCELFINDEYQGLYVLLEKIKRDDNRVDVARLDSADISGNNLSGGYIFKVDKKDSDYTEGYSGWTSMPSPSYPNAMDIVYQYVYPKAKDILPEQRTYIRNWVNKAEGVLISSSFNDPNEGYNKYYNTGSFVDFLLISELSKEVDKYRYSNYFHKHKDSRGGEIFAGPYWDFNLGYGNVNYWDFGLSPIGWVYADVQEYDWSMMFYWKRFMEDPYFLGLVKDRWNSLRENEFSNANIQHLMDSLTTLIYPAQQRNFQQWPILGTYVWPNYNWEGNNYDMEVAYFSNWLYDRLAWMDNNLFGPPQNAAALLSILEYLEPTNQLVLEVSLINDYFDHNQLEPKDFILNNAPLGFAISAVQYIDASRVRLILYAPDYESSLGWEFDVTIKESKVNGFNSLQTNTVITDVSSLVLLNNAIDIKLTAEGIAIDCSRPEMLSNGCYVYNSLGQCVGMYSLSKQNRNTIPKPNLPGVYVVSLQQSGVQVSEKIVVQ